MKSTTDSLSLSPKPEVAIIIAAYNAEKTLPQAISSALAEPEVAEVVVVDDASRDDTSDAARKADDGTGRLKVLRQDSNQGPSAARNRAIAESRSPWIGILDADDFFMPGRIAAMLAHAEDADLIADDLWQVTEDNLTALEETLLDHAIREPRLIDFSTFVRANVTSKFGKRGELGFIKPLMRRDFLDQHNIRYKEVMRLGEDYELYARALADGARCWLLPPKGYVSVCHPHSLSGRHSEDDLFHLRECDRTLDRLPSLSDADRDALRQHYLSVDCKLQWRLVINAVKARDWKAFGTAFRRPWPVPAYLAARLAEQLVVRSARAVGLAPPAEN